MSFFIIYKNLKFFRYVLEGCIVYISSFRQTTYKTPCQFIDLVNSKKELCRVNITHGNHNILDTLKV